MLLRYYGVVNPVDGTPTDPKAVNDFFARGASCGAGGCVSLGYWYGLVRWPAAGDYSREANFRFGTPKIVWNGAAGYDLATVQQDINAERPAILGVPGHWVVATGYAGATVTINDPLFQRTRLDDPAYDNTAVQGIRRYARTSTDYSSIQVAVPAPATILLTDSVGNRTGFDPATSSVLEEIPGSTYYSEQALSDDTTDAPPSSEDPALHAIVIAGPSTGEYVVQLFVPGTGAYSFAVYGSTTDGSLRYGLLEGSAPPGQTLDITFSYDANLESAPLALDIAIDIKPDSPQNPINPKSRGLTPVAVLSAPGFDAFNQVDPASLTFGRTGFEDSLANCSSEPVDANADGLPDLLCHFHTQQAGFAQGDTAALLKGQTRGGIPITGTDTVATVP
jgi:hypothetical protein